MFWLVVAILFVCGLVYCLWMPDTGKPLPNTKRPNGPAGSGSVDGENPKDRLGVLKPPLDLIPASAEIVESLVMALGAKKYGAFNWRHKNVRASIYIAACRRHLSQWFDGQDFDAESGVSHLAHARACLGILIDALACGRAVDDRPPAGKASKLIEDASKFITKRAQA